MSRLMCNPDGTVRSWVVIGWFFTIYPALPFTNTSNTVTQVVLVLWLAIWLFGNGALLARDVKYREDLPW